MGYLTIRNLKENAKTLDEVKALIQNVEQGKLI